MLSGGLAAADGTYPAVQIVLSTNIGALGVWCVDLFHTINIGGSYTYNPVPLTNDNSGSSPAGGSAPARRPTPITAGCHFYFARPVPFLYCADIARVAAATPFVPLQA